MDSILTESIGFGLQREDMTAPVCLWQGSTALVILTPMGGCLSLKQAFWARGMENCQKNDEKQIFS